MPAVDYFLKIDGVDGESSDSKHKGEIEVLSWSWGQTNTGRRSSGGGGGSGKVQLQDFHFVQHTNKASPMLMKACATGQHFQKAQLIGRRSGQDGGLEFLKVIFSDAIVTSVQVGGAAGGGDVPMDQISINFSKVEFFVTPQNPISTDPS